MQKGNGRRRLGLYSCSRLALWGGKRAEKAERLKTAFGFEFIAAREPPRKVAIEPTAERKRRAANVAFMVARQFSHIRRLFLCLLTVWLKIKVAICNL